MERSESGIQIGEEAVREFVERLQKWGHELPAEQAVLLDLMVQRALGWQGDMVEPPDFGPLPRPKEDFPPDVRRNVMDVLGTLIRDRSLFFDPRGHNTWYKGSNGGSTWTRV